jgi:hypothetical protein
MNMHSQVENISRLKFSNGICWGSIFVGVATAIMVALLLNLLSTCLGLATIDVDNVNASEISTIAMVWVIISGSLAMLAGGWVAGRSCGSETPVTGMIHGFLVSSISTLIAIGLITSTAGAAMSGIFSILGKSLSSAGSVASSLSSAPSSLNKVLDKLPPNMQEKVKNALPDMHPILNKIQDETDKLLNNLTVSDKDKRKLNKAIKEFVTTIGTEKSASARDRAVDLLTQASGKNKNEIDDMVKGWEQAYGQMKDKIADKSKEIANDTARSLSQFALIDLVILIFGTLAACLGGRIGVRSNSQY